MSLFATELYRPDPAEPAPPPFRLLEGGSLPCNPEHRRQRRRSLLWSLLLQVGLVGLMVAALQLGPPLPLNPTTEMIYFEVQPLLTYVPPAPRVPVARTVRRRPPSPRIAPPPRPVPRALAPRASPPATRPVAPPATKPTAPPAARPAAPPALAPDPVIVPPRRAPLLPSSAPVQLGRFGDPAGLDPSPNPKPTDLAPQLGRFGQAAIADPAPEPGRAVAEAGFGSPAAAAARAGGGDPGTVRASGFGVAASTTGFSLHGSSPLPVHTGNFAMPTHAPAAAAAVVPAAPAFQPPQILSWPRPAYTPAAAAQKIEGEVILEVRLGANGAVAIVRVVRGLGYGLDQSAMAAARALHFRPARRHGRAVDWTVLLHIRFQLAY